MPHRSLNRRLFLGSTAAALAGAGLAKAAAPAAYTPAVPDSAAELAKIGHTPHTKFAINLQMWWNNLPFLDRIRNAAALGFPGIEFWPWEDKDMDAVKQLCLDLGIKIAQFSAWSFEPGMNNPKNLGKFVKQVEASCKLANKMDVKKLCVVGGNNQPGMTKKQMHENIIHALKTVVPIATEHKVMLVLESMNGRVDHPNHCLYGSPDAVHICREVNSPYVKILWDLYHMHISEGDLCGHLKEGFDQLGYVQIADHPGRHEPGTGEIHYNRVLRQLYELGYHDFVGVECVPTDPIPAARAVAAADAW